MEGVAARLAPLLERILGGELPVRVRAWDGSVIGPPDAPAFVIRHRRALRRLLWKPGEIGLARAYVAGELDIEGDLFDALAAVGRVLWRGDDPIRLSGDDKRDIVRSMVMLGAVGPEPKPPPEEFAATEESDSRSEHIDAVGTAFFERMLRSTMEYTSGDWTHAKDLDDAQEAAQRRAAEALELEPGMRLLDLTCGWGSFAIHVARQHGVSVVGLTPSRKQAAQARDRVAEAGLEDRVEVRTGDFQAAGGGPYDAIVALSGVDRVDGDAAELHDLLEPGGRLLLRQLVRRPGAHTHRRTFTNSYVFPGDGELPTLGELVTVLEEGGFEIRGAEALREHYARTQRAWAANLHKHWAACAEAASQGRARVWLLYLVASALAAESGWIGMHELLAMRRPGPG